MTIMHQLPSVPQLMAIVNITHNSFSDGRQFMPGSKVKQVQRSEIGERHSENIDYSGAIDYCHLAVEQGATILDLGGEATSPRAPRTAQELERKRVIPLVQKLADKYCISVDTMRSSIAREALECGASIINDVSGGLADPQMAAVIADYPMCQWVISHWAPLPQTNLVDDIKQHFDVLISEALACGVREEQIILDPGLGFAKDDPAQNWAILHGLDVMSNWGFPLLLGASRKRFIAHYGKLTQDQDIATAIITALMSKYHPWAIRVHNVKLNQIALEIAQKFPAI